MTTTTDIKALCELIDTHVRSLKNEILDLRRTCALHEADTIRLNDLETISNHALTHFDRPILPYLTWPVGTTLRQALDQKIGNLHTP